MKLRNSLYHSKSDVKIKARNQLKVIVKNIMILNVNFYHIMILAVLIEILSAR